MVMLKTASMRLIIVVGVGVAEALVAGRSGGASAQQTPTESGKPSLDYEFFKVRIEPIFLEHRTDHARCYSCHQMPRHNGGPLSLQVMPAGMTFWTEEQSQMNFKTVSKIVIPGAPLSSIFLLEPLAPEAGGAANMHQGGRQFASQDDPDWQNMKAWVNGAKLENPSKSH
jgi:hypothetical protein